MMGPLVDIMSELSRTTLGWRLLPKYRYACPSSSMNVIGSMGSGPVFASREVSMRVSRVRH